MSRTTMLAALTGAVLLGGLAAPALADTSLADQSLTSQSLAETGDRASICLRLDPEGGREGLCVWLPFPPPGS